MLLAPKTVGRILVRVSESLANDEVKLIRSTVTHDKLSSKPHLGGVLALKSGCESAAPTPRCIRCVFFRECGQDQRLPGVWSNWSANSELAPAALSSLAASSAIETTTLRGVPILVCILRHVLVRGWCPLRRGLLDHPETPMFEDGKIIGDEESVSEVVFRALLLRRLAVLSFDRKKSTHPLVCLKPGRHRPTSMPCACEFGSCLETRSHKQSDVDDGALAVATLS